MTSSLPPKSDNTEPPKPAQHGGPGKTLRVLAVPIVISFTTRFLFSFVDLAFAAAYLDKASVAAIGYFIPFQAVYIAIWVGLSGGLTATLAGSFGTNDEPRIRTLKQAALRILLVLIPTLMTLGIGLWFLVPSFGLDEALTDRFQLYGTTVWIGMAITGFWAIIPDSIIKAHQDTRSTMVAGLIASFTNLGLNTLFLLVFGWGLFGIALATICSRLTSLSYAWWRAKTLERARHDQAADAPQRTVIDPAPAPNRTGPTAAILALSLPGGLVFGLAAGEGAVINALLNELPDSTTAIAAWGVFWQLFSLSVMPAAGTSVAVVPFAAKLIPRGEIERVRREVFTMIGWIALVSLAITVLAGFVFPESIASFFVRERAADGTRLPPSPETIELLRMLPLVAVATVPFYLVRPLFEAAQRPRLGIRVAWVRYLVFSIPLLLVTPALSSWLGIGALQGLPLALAIAAAGSSFLACIMALRMLRELQPGP